MILKGRTKKRGTLRRGGLVVMVGVLTVAGLTSVVSAERATIEGTAPFIELVDYVPNPQLEGRLAIAGSDTMKPLLTRLAGDFLVQHPKVKIAIEGGGSTLGIHEFVMGYSSQRRGDKARSTGHEGANQVTVLASSRGLTDQERYRFSSRFGYEPLAFPIALDAVAIYVHRTNPIQSLTLEQIDGIFSSTHKRESQDITTWGQFGLEGWEAQPMHLYGRDKRSGTHDFFQETALTGGTLKASVTEEPGSASEVLAIARDQQAIGYAGVGFQISDVKVVPLAMGTGSSAVLPTTDSVGDGRYPLSRSLYLYVNRDPKEKFDPVLLEFLRYVNSPRGQEMVASAKAYPLPQGIIAQNLILLNAASLTASASSSSH